MEDLTEESLRTYLDNHEKLIPIVEERYSWKEGGDILSGVSLRYFHKEKAILISAVARPNNNHIIIDYCLTNVVGYEDVNCFVEFEKQLKRIELLNLADPWSVNLEDWSLTTRKDNIELHKYNGNEYTIRRFAIMYHRLSKFPKDIQRRLNFHV